VPLKFKLTVEVANMHHASLEGNVDLLTNGGRLVFYMNGKKIEILRYERWIKDLKKEVYRELIRK